MTRITCMGEAHVAKIARIGVFLESDKVSEEVLVDLQDLFNVHKNLVALVRSEDKRMSIAGFGTNAVYYTLYRGTPNEKDKITSVTYLHGFTNLR